jgi:hypothetical protein
MGYLLLTVFVAGVVWFGVAAMRGVKRRPLPAPEASSGRPRKARRRRRS